MIRGNKMILLRVCVLELRAPDFLVFCIIQNTKDKHSFARWSLVRRVSGTKLEDDCIFDRIPYGRIPEPHPWLPNTLWGGNLRPQISHEKADLGVPNTTYSTGMTGGFWMSYGNWGASEDWSIMDEFDQDWTQSGEANFVNQCQEATKSAWKQTRNQHIDI